MTTRVGILGLILAAGFAVSQPPVASAQDRYDYRDAYAQRYYADQNRRRDDDRWRHDRWRDEQLRREEIRRREWREREWRQHHPGYYNYGYGASTPYLGFEYYGR